MFQEEKTFVLRFNLVAGFSDDYDGDEDGYVWLREWETRLKPELLKAVMSSLRTDPSWSVRIRNRGMSATDEVEIVLEKVGLEDGDFPSPPL